ncbi:DNA polymerase epsilon subunit 2 isoform X1 [Arctopsyche grandis]
MDLNLKKEIAMAFKLNGFSLRKESCLFLMENFANYSADDRKNWINKIILHVQNQQLHQSIIEMSHIKLAIKESSNNGLEESETIFNVINAFQIPKFNYNIERKKFLRDEKNSLKVDLYPEARWRFQYLLDRYILILQRTARNKVFTPETLPGTKQEKGFSLRKVEHLLSCSSRINEVIVLGLLTQLTEGTYYLEDPTGAVALDLSLVRYQSGLFTEHCFVLAEGHYEDRILHVMGLVMPPAECRSISQVYYGNVNTFGGPSKTLLKNSENLSKIEKANEDAMILFLADVWLDDVKVLSRLKSLFSGYNGFPPAAIVFMGEFLSCPYGYEHGNQLKTAFKALADILSQYPQLLEACKFVFVPGSADPSSPNILPRPHLPEFITEDIRSKLGDRVIFTSNPCRIQYCTQEIVVLRHNLVTKMCRNSIHFPESGDIPDHLMKTLLGQCTLAPLSIGVQPVYWQHADALNLYPMPDLVVIADNFKPYTRSYQNCQFINPGSFPRTDFSFKVYMPASRTIEDSQIPNEDL